MRVKDSNKRSEMSYRTNCLNPHFPSIVDIQCGEKAILL